MQEYSVKVTLPDGQVMAVTASESDTLEAVADRFKDYYCLLYTSDAADE